MCFGFADNGHTDFFEAVYKTKVEKLTLEEVTKALAKGNLMSETDPAIVSTAKKIHQFAMA